MYAICDYMNHWEQVGLKILPTLHSGQRLEQTPASDWSCCCWVRLVGIRHLMTDPVLGGACVFERKEDWECLTAVPQQEAMCFPKIGCTLPLFHVSNHSVPIGSFFLNMHPDFYM